MRTIATALFVLAALACAADPALARKPKPAPKSGAAEGTVSVPTADRATAGPLRAAYAAMPFSDRVSIQSDLIWTGDYNGVTDGEFSDRAIAAVKAFQKRNGGKETGLLTADERDKLAAAAAPRVEKIGWRMLNDAATGAQIGLPGKLVPQTSAAKGGTHWQSARGEMQVNTFLVTGKGTTLAAVLQEQKSMPGRTVEYTVTKPDFFVISGMQGGVKKFYVRAHVNNEEVRGISILYDRAMEGIVDKVVVAMSSAFTPFPSGELTIERRRSAQLRRKVEYGTGIVVSNVGHILTDRQLLEDCVVVTIPGLGNADRVAEDKTSNLALLRVYGAHGLPAVIATGGDGDFSLLGIADPQSQNGGSLISTTRARASATSGAGRTIEPAPVQGFTGAAAVNADGRLVGMVELKPPVVAGPASTSSQAVIIPAEILREFLTAQQVTPATDSAGDAKASIVRVICVRK